MNAVKQRKFEAETLPQITKTQIDYFRFLVKKIRKQ